MNLERIKSNVTLQSDGCWIWQKSTNSAGYGQLTENKRYWLAHRYALACVRVVSPNDVVRHSCHNTKCCNPEHLSIGCHKDNYRDSLHRHAEADSKRRKEWIVNGVLYETCRKAHKETKLPIQTLIKYTVGGVFDVEAYRIACKAAKRKPRV